MCCKGCCSRRISKVQAYVLFGFCTLIAIVGVALVVYGVIWDTKPTPEEFGMPVLYSIYKEQEGFQGYNLFYTVYKQTLSWAGFLVSLRVRLSPADEFDQSNKIDQLLRIPWGGLFSERGIPRGIP